MPVWDPSDRGSYRLSDPEVPALWGLSDELLTLVEEGLGGAVRAGRAVSAVHALSEFERRRGSAAGATKMLLGFGMARPLLRADRVLLADRLLLEADDLCCGQDPVGLYGVSVVLEEARRGLGVHRRRLVKGCVDSTRCLNVVGMVSVLRPRVSTVQGILHVAWRSDARGKALELAARWPLAFAGRDGSGAVSS